jgi:propanol-preferring alcohol dehydrogenase
MKAWILSGVYDMNSGNFPLKLVDIPTPEPGHNEVLIRISCCGICHTELDEIEGRAAPAMYPVIPGHQVIGTVAALGRNSRLFKVGERAGVAWIFSVCGKCEYCRNGRENLCHMFKGTGKDVNGGYSEYMTAKEEFVFPVPDSIPDFQAAPMLCAGAIGFRSLMLTGIQNGQTLGLMGFGASGHIVLKTARSVFPDSDVLVFARSESERKFAISLGARWAGAPESVPPSPPHAIVDTTPVWKTVLASLAALRPGGRLVINAIRKEDGDIREVLNLSYHRHLWKEKEVKTVANITRNDVKKFLKLASEIPIVPETEIYPFAKANEALFDLKFKPVAGAKVLVCS